MLACVVRPSSLRLIDPRSRATQRYAVPETERHEVRDFCVREKDMRDVGDGFFLIADGVRVGGGGARVAAAEDYNNCLKWPGHPSIVGVQQVASK